MKRRIECGTGKELPALIACVIWAGGFELAPALHAAEHASLAPHSHGDHEHSDHAPPPEHGDGSLAHRELAASSAPPLLAPIDPPCLGAIVWALPRSIAPAPVDRIPSCARGPPLLARS